MNHLILKVLMDYVKFNLEAVKM